MNILKYCVCLFSFPLGYTKDAAYLETSLSNASFDNFKNNIGVNTLDNKYSKPAELGIGVSTILKQIVIILIFIFISERMFTQTAGLNYQAYISNSEEIQIPGANIKQNQVPLSLEDVSFRFSITRETFEDIYTEEQTTTTDENGMVSLIVGDGTPLFSTFKAIDWDGNLKYLNVEIFIHSQNQGYEFLDIQKILYLPQSSSARMGVANGLYNGSSGIVKLGGSLSEPTQINTDTNNTFAINGLQEISPNVTTHNALTVNTTTGVITRASLGSLFPEKVTRTITANNGQRQFHSPLPIVTPDKIDVYRNGVLIKFTIINSAILEIEPEAICYTGDEIRIVQFPN